MDTEWTARIDDDRVENADLVFEVASLSKTLFAFCVVSLASEGKIDLERPLYEYAPDCFLSSDARARRICAKDVLCHSTGLQNWDKREDKALSFVPGTAFQYSGEGYVYLQNCLRSAFSLTFQALLDRYVNEPLNVRIASCFGAIPEGARIAYPCTLQQPYEPILQENAAYSVYATARDYAAFLRKLFADGVSDLTAWSIAVNADIRWCMGFGLFADRYAFQYGDNGDFQGLFCVDIPARHVWLRLTNDRYGLMRSVNEIKRLDVQQGITAFLQAQYGEEYAALIAPSNA